MNRPEEILSFWFGPSVEDEAAIRQKAQMWFRGGPEIDREIRDRFGPDLERARCGELASWAETPRGRLALVILLDQFSRNIYRGTPLAFAQDEAAQKLTIEGLDAKMDASLTPYERIFFVLPLGHAEDLALQERSLRYCEEWAKSLPPSQQGFAQAALAQARRHRDVIARFGRFPTRNEALGRASTPEESAYVGQVKATGEAV
jgi:uncharacterized protein (DUF924 family)